ncbi:phosphoenolpyruvate-protein phosphotransferase [Desulfoluna limicola]|uniref:Phosphoenolpyruvate-protein phosphotransferase n=1 Tax=Desulfoluna limicola TaxID=2810562 RepID=A0ABN6F7B8_9BACT|nr:phosphoenolpyruvate--protein phosphotransferase [Desulfoluna limicola]BCS97442.1 phosphoenolpyruvate-protein phosphotransferase [Desulfoluna limicola]
MVNQGSDTLLKGISGSPGICIGQAYLVDREGVDVVEKYNVLPEGIRDEVNRFKTAVKKSEDELTEVIEELPEELHHHLSILESHLALFKDKMLYGRAIEAIEGERINAEWALKKVASRAKAMFQDIADPYLQGRVDDIVQVSDRIMMNLVGADAVNIGNIDKRVVLVAKDLTPADTARIQLERIKGFVTDRGGKTSHTSIIARTLELPSVMGLGNVTALIKNDDIIIVDGNEGVVIIDPSDETLLEYEEKKARYEARRANIKRRSKIPATTVDGVTMKLMGNIELAEEIVSVMDYGGEGIGLFRTEFQYLSRSHFPTEEELYEQYREVTELIFPEPVVIRTLDINGDKALIYAKENDEENPALGLRAIRFCLQRPDVFMTQLRAILRAAAFGNMRVMFPMISGVEEVLEAKALLKEAAAQLEAEGVPYSENFEIGIMMEVPSAVVMADRLAREVDFFSIGTNDLTQYTLAIDRGNRKVAHLYNSLHPAVLRMIKHVVDVGKANDVRVCICGEMASEPAIMPVLLGLELDELSMTPQSLPAVKEMVRGLSFSESRKFAEKLMEATSLDEVAAIMDDFVYPEENENETVPL